MYDDEGQVATPITIITPTGWLTGISTSDASLDYAPPTTPVGRPDRPQPSERLEQPEVLR